MRVFNQYTFSVGNVEFSEIFVLVDDFLRQQELCYEKLCCELRDWCVDPTVRTGIAKDKRVIPNRKNAVVFGLEDLIRDHPQLLSYGKLIRREDFAKTGEELFWSDMDAYGGPVEDTIEPSSTRALASLFPTTYFLESFLYSYVNIDFFGRKREPVLEKCDRNYFERLCRNGCHISFLKETVFGRAAKLVMVIEVTGENDVFQSEPYAKALSNILGKKFTAETVIQFSETEQFELDNRKKEAQPFVDVASRILRDEAVRFGEQKDLKDQRNIQDVLFKAGMNLKKIAKTFGFAGYHYNSNNVHYLSAKIGEGHTLLFVVDVPPRCNIMRFSVHLSGLGFYYRIPFAEVYCESQEEADRQIQTGFEIVQDCLESHLMPIFSQYSKTPEWYVTGAK